MLMSIKILTYKDELNLYNLEIDYIYINEEFRNWLCSFNDSKSIHYRRLIRINFLSKKIDLVDTWEDSFTDDYNLTCYFSGSNGLSRHSDNKILYIQPCSKSILLKYSLPLDKILIQKKNLLIAFNLLKKKYLHCVNKV